MPEGNGHEDPKVVMRQNLLTVAEVFVYRLPRMKSSSGHRAEDWDLANPLATCSMSVDRCDDCCLISFMTEKPKAGGPDGATEPSLFARSKISLVGGCPLRHWVEGVVDSSRYFAVRISGGHREAHIGMGFRERDDASNFKMSLQEYENSIRREQKAKEIQLAYLEEAGGDGNVEESSSERGKTSFAAGKLGLKEGEKIHIKLKGNPVRPRKEKHSSAKAAAPLLRKPPPPPPNNATEEVGLKVERAEMNIVLEQSTGTAEEECGSSEGAVVDADEDDFDDEWGEFEGSTER